MRRSIPSVMAAAFAALATLSACGAPAVLAPDTLPMSAPQAPSTSGEISPTALGVPPPSRHLRSLSPAKASPATIDEADPRLYEVLVALEGPRAFVLGVEARADYAPPWGPEPAVDPSAVCPSSTCGTASLPAGAPAEAAYWLAVADLHWRDAHEGAHRGMLRTRGADLDPAESVSSNRQIVRFTPQDGVECASQQKWFAAATEPAAQPVDPVVAAEQNAHRITPDALPVGRSAAGRGQLLLRQRTRLDGRYVVELHVALDHDAPREAEVMDAVVVCESDAPIGPLAALDHRLARGDDGQWTVVVFPR